MLVLANVCLPARDSQEKKNGVEVVKSQKWKPADSTKQASKGKGGKGGRGASSYTRTHTHTHTHTHFLPLIQLDCLIAVVSSSLSSSSCGFGWDTTQKGKWLVVEGYGVQI